MTFDSSGESLVVILGPVEPNEPPVGWECWGNRSHSFLVYMDEERWRLPAGTLFKASVEEPV